jgi:triosephosphate isomerase
MKIIASNFKTNHTRLETRKFIETINNVISENNITNEVIIFPSLTALDSFDNLNANLAIGTQNAYYIDNGSFTGEVGSDQLKEFNIQTILIGHSERRHILKETQEDILAKYNYYKDLGYKIVYCIGEPLEVKNQGIEEVLKYLKTQLQGVDIDYEKLIIAYEPIWAIGTGVVPTIDDVKSIHKALKNSIKKPILYGGSVKVNNINQIISIDGVDGVLVGSGSWDINNFIEMVKV